MQLSSPDPFGKEISDLIVDFDPHTHEPVPVRREDVREYFANRGNHRARRIVESLEHQAGYLSLEAVESLLLRVHLELQRLHEEFLHPHRVLDLLRPMIASLRAQGVPKPWRVVDVGCGLGYVIRWLASEGNLGADVELVGVDYNRPLVDRGAAAARLENLRCELRTGNAFCLDSPGTIFISTGVLHHFRGDNLDRVFGQQRAASTAGFAHFDILPTWLTPIGAWIFHQARMRTPLARHDGLLSALRAHHPDRLSQAARSNSDLRVALLDANPGFLPILRIFLAVLGLRPELLEPFTRALGLGRLRLGTWR